MGEIRTWSMCKEWVLKIARKYIERAVFSGGFTTLATRRSDLQKAFVPLRQMYQKVFAVSPGSDKTEEGSSVCT